MPGTSSVLIDPATVRKKDSGKRARPGLAKKKVDANRFPRAAARRTGFRPAAKRDDGRIEKSAKALPLAIPQPRCVRAERNNPPKAAFAFQACSVGAYSGQLHSISRTFFAGKELSSSYSGL